MASQIADFSVQVSQKLVSLFAGGKSSASKTLPSRRSIDLLLRSSGLRGKVLDHLGEGWSIEAEIEPSEFTMHGASGALVRWRVRKDGTTMLIAMYADGVIKSEKPA